MTRWFAAPLALALGLSCGCASSAFIDEGLEGLELSSVRPGIVVEGTTMVVEGASFVGSSWGGSSLHLAGSFTDISGGERFVDVTLPARFVDFDVLEIDVTAELLAQFGGDGDFAGDATVEVISSVDNELYSAGPLVVSLEFRSQLQPELDLAQTGGVIFVNDPIVVEGAGLLLGGNEGTTYAVIEGCFTPAGDVQCNELVAVEVPVVVESAFLRDRGRFAFGPEIAGISPGAFAGTVSLRNAHGAGASLSSASKPTSYELIEPAIFQVSPTAASLGQYVDITGGGFVGGEAGTDTTLRLVGSFTLAGSGSSQPVDILLIPEFVDGRRTRYVINENDALGQALDLRDQTGRFEGELTPEISYRGDRVVGTPAAMSLAIAPVRQVVYLSFAPTYVESLRHFGLRAVDQKIREQVVAVVSRDYATINLDVRIEAVTDFAAYSEVHIAGPDPNGLGLFGYDNTPGKDVGNQRLYDRIGGVNASTQEDGFPGFGGVFIESLFGFSEHPEGRAESLSGASPAFDDIFDPFRPDRNGTRVRAADLSGGVPQGDAASCPAADRSAQLGCAIYVLGNLIGTTVSHEIGHSLGLANPYGEGFHNQGDSPNRLMDSGGARSFTERAQLQGDGPAVFCAEEYTYLRDILPSLEPEDTSPRPSCF